MNFVEAKTRIAMMKDRLDIANRVIKAMREKAGKGIKFADVGIKFCVPEAGAGSCVLRGELLQFRFDILLEPHLTCHDGEQDQPAAWVRAVERGGEELAAVRVTNLVSGHCQGAASQNFETCEQMVDVLSDSFLSALTITLANRLPRLAVE